MKTLLKIALTAIFGLLLGREIALWLTPPAELRGETRILTTLGSIDWTRSSRGEVRIALRNSDNLYRAEIDPRLPIRGALLDEKSSEKMLVLRIYLDRARFNTRENRAEYWVESLTYEGKTYGRFPLPAPGGEATVTADIAGLLRGVALEDAELHAEAERALGLAISNGTLGGKPLALAYRMRGNAREYQAYPRGGDVNDRDDQLLVNAAHDYRQAATLDPDDRRNIVGEGRTLDKLGAYAESLAIQDEILRRWPEELFRVQIRRSATYRKMGDYPAALRTLDDLVTEHGPQRSMMFHYHRGRTLLGLKDYRGAVSAFSTGLENQPDYFWAYAKRACAYGNLGEIEKGLADLRRGRELWAAYSAGSSAVESQQKMLDAIDASIREFEAAMQPKPHPIEPRSCADPDSSPSGAERERSRLFNRPPPRPLPRTVES